jgi:hypothetical protein
MMQAQGPNRAHINRKVSNVPQLKSFPAYVGALECFRSFGEWLLK